MSLKDAKVKPLLSFSARGFFHVVVGFNMCQTLSNHAFVSSIFGMITRIGSKAQLGVHKELGETLMAVQVETRLGLGIFPWQLVAMCRFNYLGCNDDHGE